MDCLSNRIHFEQIDPSCSILYSNFVVPHGTILGPLLFNICVADISDCLPNFACLQFTDDSTIYQHCSLKDLETWFVNFEKTFLDCPTGLPITNLTSKQLRHGSNESLPWTQQNKRYQNQIYGKEIRICKLMETSGCCNWSTLRLEIPY